MPPFSEGQQAILLFMIIALAAWAINTARAREKRRTRDLVQARLALEAHLAAVRKLVGDPAVSPDAKEFLQWLSFQISDKTFAWAVISDIEAERATGTRAGKSTMVEGLRELAGSRPDLLDAFHEAMRSALAFLYLRWPGNADKFQQLAVDLAKDAQRDKAIAQKLANLMRASGGGRQSAALAAE